MDRKRALTYDVRSVITLQSYDVNEFNKVLRKLIETLSAYSNEVSVKEITFVFDKSIVTVREAKSGSVVEVVVAPKDEAGIKDVPKRVEAILQILAGK